MGVAASELNIYRVTAPVRIRKYLRRFAFYICLLILTSPTVFIFFRMSSLSLKPDIQNIAYPPVFIPRSPTLDNF